MKSVHAALMALLIFVVICAVFFGIATCSAHIANEQVLAMARLGYTQNEHGMWVKSP